MIYNSYSLISLIAVFFAAVIAITLHEFAHGYVALLNGDRTAKFNGRLTLNPIKHFDPFGFLMMMFVGFGYAKPVPVNPNNFRHLKKGIFTVAIAGIAVNITLAFLITPLQIVFSNLAFKLAETNDLAYNLISFLYQFTFFLIRINISLALFNLLPFYPLDGFRVVEAFTRYRNKATTFLREYGSYILMGLIGVSIIIDLLNLKEINPAFAYLDLLGVYVGGVGSWIKNGFDAFWRLLGVGA